METLKAPFPWFGGKSKIASIVWERFGNVGNYVEPFFGSGAVLLGRPQPFDGIETVNDKDGFVSNFWRSIKSDPEQTAHYADWPVNENDLHARHIWLVNRRDELKLRLEGDPDYFDPKIAGWWVWGISCWIGGGWCSGNGPRQSQGGQLVHLRGAGMGVNRKRVHLGEGMGIYEWFESLSERLLRVRVCCGDWKRVMGPTPTFLQGLSGVFLDPPYGDDAERDMTLYSEESGSVATEVREWAIANGDNPLLRIALCGYEDEHEMPSDWEKVSWKATGGYGSQGNSSGRENSFRERIWFSPHCLSGRQETLF